MSSSADSARLVPVVKRANCLILNDEARRLLDVYPQQAAALARMWSTDPAHAINQLTAAAWDTAFTSGYSLDQATVERAVTRLLAGDLAGYEAVLFTSVTPSRVPGAYVDDGSRPVTGDEITDTYLRKLADLRAQLPRAGSDQATELLATYAHRLLKLRQRRREMLGAAAR